jgi:hypothetical protein
MSLGLRSFINTLYICYIDTHLTPSQPYHTCTYMPGFNNQPDTYLDPRERVPSMTLLCLPIATAKGNPI